jgi:hypothetical protein
MSSPDIDLMLNYTAHLWSSGKNPILTEPQAVETFRKWGYFSQKFKIRNSEKK